MTVNVGAWKGTEKMPRGDTRTRKASEDGYKRMAEEEKKEKRR